MLRSVVRLYAALERWKNLTIGFADLQAPCLISSLFQPMDHAQLSLLSSLGGRHFHLLGSFPSDLHGRVRVVFCLWDEEGFCRLFCFLLSLYQI